MGDTRVLCSIDELQVDLFVVILQRAQTFLGHTLNTLLLLSLCVLVELADRLAQALDLVEVAPIACEKGSTMVADDEQVVEVLLFRLR